MKCLLATLILILATSTALAEGLNSKFYGAYVGSGVAEDLEENITELRDLDITIEPYKNDGFTMNWVTVVRDPTGERTGEDVKRREVEENFLPFDNRENVYVLAPRGSLFTPTELPNPLCGGPARWATVENGAITVYSVAINNKGASELHIYRRTLTEKGMNLSFLRMQNENVVVRMTGTLVKTK